MRPEWCGRSTCARCSASPTARRVIDLFESLMRGDIASALTELCAQYETGADPAVVLSDLAEFTHFVTRVKIVPAVAEDPTLIEVERVRGRACAEKLSMRVLSRTWQMLLKGLMEVAAAGRPLAAAEMVLVRIAYARTSPRPRKWSGRIVEREAPSRTGRPPATGGMSAPSMSGSELSRGKELSQAPYAGAGPVANDKLSARNALPDGKAEPPVIACFEDLIALAAEKRDLGVKLALERDVRLVRCEDGRLGCKLEKTASRSLVNDLARKISQWTNQDWIVVVSTEEGQPTVKSQNDARKTELKSDVRANPLVQAVLARFPGAEIVDVRKGGETTACEAASNGQGALDMASDQSPETPSTRIALSRQDDA